MRAILLHAFGPAENLRYEEVDDPVPGPDQVRIAVAAAGVHLIDTVIRSGRPQGPMRSGSAGAWWRTSGRRAAATPNSRSPTPTRCTPSLTASPTTPRWP